MAEDPKNTQKEFPGCCEGTPFADIMRKMMEAKKSGSSSSCAEMMSQMKQMFFGAGKEKEECAQKQKENPGSNA